MREPLVRPQLVPHLPMKMYAFHKWYMEAVVDGWIMFAAWVQDHDYFRGLDDIWIEFESLWYLYHQDALDKSLISAWVL